MLGIIFDIILVAIIALNVFICYRKGLVKLAVGLIAVIVAIIVSVVLYKPVSNIIIENTDIDENIENTINNSSETSEKTSSEQDYFSLTKLERDTMYSQTLETYQKMLDNEKLTNEQKAIAVQEISNVTEEKNAIKISENLIKNKGYEEVVILKNSDNVNVIVKAKKLETEDIAKIQNIITRELKVDLDKINISCR